ncbi:unnamed protein product [Ixodes persulcatus]
MTAAAKEAIQSVQVFGRKKTATAVAYCKRGNGLLKVNGRPLENIEPLTLRYKLLEPILLLGKERFAGVDIRIRVKGGGNVAQIYAIRQAISKALVAYYQKCKCPLPWLSSTGFPGSRELPRESPRVIRARKYPWPSLPPSKVFLQSVTHKWVKANWQFDVFLENRSSSWMVAKTFFLCEALEKISLCWGHSHRGNKASAESVQTQSLKPRPDDIIFLMLWSFTGFH